MLQVGAGLQHASLTLSVLQEQLGGVTGAAYQPPFCAAIAELACLNDADLAELLWRLRCAHAQLATASAGAVATPADCAAALAVCAPHMQWQSAASQAAGAQAPVIWREMVAEAAAHVEQQCLTVLRISHTRALVHSAASLRDDSAPDLRACPERIEQLCAQLTLLVSQLPSRATPELWLSLASVACAMQYASGAAAWAQCAAVAGQGGAQAAQSAAEGLRQLCEGASANGGGSCTSEDAYAALAAAADGVLPNRSMRVHAGTNVSSFPKAACAARTTVWWHIHIQVPKQRCMHAAIQVLNALLSAAGQPNATGATSQLRAALLQALRTESTARDQDSDPLTHLAIDALLLLSSAHAPTHVRPSAPASAMLQSVLAMFLIHSATLRVLPPALHVRLREALPAVHASLQRAFTSGRDCGGGASPAGAGGAGGWQTRDALARTGLVLVLQVLYKPANFRNDRMPHLLQRCQKVVKQFERVSAPPPQQRRRHTCMPEAQSLSTCETGSCKCKLFASSISLACAGAALEQRRHRREACGSRQREATATARRE